MTIEIRVSDFKQWAYCPRIVFFERVLGVVQKATWKMERGVAEQGEEERLERRRLLERYGLNEGERLFNLAVSSERLGLSGVVDMVVVTGDAVYPVDFKRTSCVVVRRSYRLQLAAYAMLLEERFVLPSPRGFVCMTVAKKVAPIDIAPSLRDDVVAVAEQIRSAIREELFPERRALPGRCAECFYVHYCGDE